MALMPLMFNMQKLLAEQQAAIEAQVDVKSSETQALVTSQSLETTNRVTTESDEVQLTLMEIDTSIQTLSDNLVSEVAHISTAIKQQVIAIGTAQAIATTGDWVTVVDIAGAGMQTYIGAAQAPNASGYARVRSIIDGVEDHQQASNATDNNQFVDNGRSNIAFGKSLLVQVRGTGAGNNIGKAEYILYGDLS